MNITISIVWEPPVDVVPIDLLNVLVVGVGVAIHNRMNIFLPRMLHTHLLVEPVRCAFLKRTAASTFGAVKIDLLAVTESLVRIEVDPVP